MTASMPQAKPSAYPHLCDAARAIIESDSATRILFTKKAHWIGYTQANLILGGMREMLEAPQVDRMECLAILGETNNGKTRILRRFMDTCAPKTRTSGTGSEWSVIAIQAPPVADEKRLYTTILRQVGGLGTSNQTRASIFQATITTLGNLGTRMLVIDEIHHLISGSTNQHRTCLTALKYLANELQLSIVVAGISTAHYVLGTIDPQLENRFKPILLPHWKDGPEFRRLLASIETLLPLKEPSELQRPDMAKRLSNLIDGKIGELMSLLTAAAIEAIKTGKERIDGDTITKVQGLAPAYRKASLKDGL